MSGNIRVFVLASAVAGLASAAGCGPTLGTRAMVARFAGDGELHCPSVSAADVTQLHEDAFEVRGCGRIVDVADVAQGRRRRWQVIRPAVSRAVEDLRCAIDDSAPSGPQWPTQRTLAGCGESITYRLTCDDDGCTWVATAQAVVAAPAVDQDPSTDTGAGALGAPGGG